MPRLLTPAAAALAAAVVAAAPAAGDALHAARSRHQTTELISRSLGGGVPNGPASNAVISDDKRFARLIAYQSSASDIVRGDTNGTSDVFAVRRRGPVANNGAAWRPGKTILVSRGLGGAPANGPSFAPAVDGGFHSAPHCVAFLSNASNLVRGDTNGVTDAFVSHGPGGAPQRVSLPGGRQSPFPTTQVAISGDCKRIAFVAGGRLFVRAGNRTVALGAPGVAADPSFSTGLRDDLVFGAAGGVYLSAGGTGAPRLVAPGGSDPAYNDIKRRVVTYVRSAAGYQQVFARDLGKGERLVSGFHGRPGNGDSTHPVIGNAGYYITFETRATNLGTTASSARTDHNGRPDVYLYTDVRHITLAQSVHTKGVPIGGSNPSMSFYANYITFDAPGAHGSQVLLRWLGGL